MAQPRRHGMRWSTVPTPMPDGGMPIAIRGSGPGGSTAKDLTPASQPMALPQVLPVQDLNAFLSSLPKESLSFITKSLEVRYDHAKIVGEAISIGTLAVPQTYVWVFTDIEFYARSPRSGLLGAPQMLDAGALVGLLKLDILFGGGSPLNTTSYRMSPYTSPGQVAATTSGWPWLEKLLGTGRALTFALYAKESQSIGIQATIEDAPRFPIATIGANLQGFALPSSVFAKIWSP